MLIKFKEFEKFLPDNALCLTVDEEGDVFWWSSFPVYEERIQEYIGAGPKGYLGKISLDVFVGEDHALCPLTPKISGEKLVGFLCSVWDGPEEPTTKTYKMITGYREEARLKFRSGCAGWMYARPATREEVKFYG